MCRQKFFRMTIAFLSGLILVSLASSPAFALKAASSKPPGPEAPSEAMKVSPSKLEVLTQPAQETSATIEVFNDSSKALKVRFSAWDFARDEQGAVYQISEKDAAKFGGAAKWLIYPKTSMTLAAGQRKKFNILIKVPRDAAPGSHATYLRVLGSPTDPGKNITVRYAINALFLPIVLEKTHGKMPTLKTAVRLIDFSAGGKLHMLLPFDLAARVRNDGNIHQNFEGVIEVMQGKVKLGSFPLKQTLLPEQTAMLAAPVEEIPYFGKFKAKFVGAAFLAKSHTRQPVKAQITFWYLPRTLLLTAGAIVLSVLLLSFWLLRRRLRRIGKSQDLGES